MKGLAMRIRRLFGHRAPCANDPVAALLAVKRNTAADRKQSTAEVRHAMKEQAGALSLPFEEIADSFTRGRHDRR